MKPIKLKHYVQFKKTTKLSKRVAKAMEYIEEKQKLASKSWKDVNVDKFLREIRGNYSDN